MGKFIAECTQKTEFVAHLLAALAKTSKRHQPSRLEMLHLEDRTEQFMHCMWGNATFCWFTGCINLNENVKSLPYARCLAVKLVRKTFSIDRVHKVDDRYDEFDFVRLKPANKMPTNG